MKQRYCFTFTSKRNDKKLFVICGFEVGQNFVYRPMEAVNDKSSKIHTSFSKNCWAVKAGLTDKTWEIIEDITIKMMLCSMKKCFLKTSTQTEHVTYLQTNTKTSYSSFKPTSLPHWLLLPTGIPETSTKLFVLLAQIFSKGIACSWDSYPGN